MKGLICNALFVFLNPALCQFVARFFLECPLYNLVVTFLVILYGLQKSDYVVV